MSRAKKEFCQIMRSIENLWRYLDKVTNEFRIELYEDNECYNLINALIDYLAYEFDDENELIEWFCYDKDFGKRKDLGGIFVDDDEYSIETPEDLFDILTGFKEKKI